MAGCEAFGRCHVDGPILHHTIIQTPVPGLGEKYWSLSGFPSHSFQSAGGALLTTIFGQIFAYSAFSDSPPQINPAFENLAGAWELDKRGVQFPVAVYPTYVHARLRAQRSCFTIHGREKQSLNELIPERILKRYAIDPGSRQAMINELRLLGVSDSVVLPDLDGLALELKTQFL